MIKKVLVILLMFLLLFSVEALANDGGAMLDDKGFLSVKYKLHSTEVEIGGAIDFTLILKNNTNYPIELVQIKKFIKDTYIPLDDWIKVSEKIDVGQQITIDITTEITPDIYWYKKGNEFFCNFDLGLMYYATYYNAKKHGKVDEEYFDDYNWHHINKPLKTIPLKIINLHDGNNYLGLKLDESKETTFNFPKGQHFELNIYNGELRSNIYNKIIAQNKSTANINNIYFRHETYDSKKDRSNKSILTPNDTVNSLVYNSYFINPNNLPNELPADYKVLFQVDNLYYATEITRTYPTKILEEPQFDYSVIHNNGNKHREFKYIVTIKNKMNINSQDMYIDFDTYSTFREDNNKKKQEIEYLQDTNEYKIYTNQYERFYLGYKVSKFIYWWDYDISGNIENGYDIYFLDFRGKEPLELYNATPTPSPTQVPTPSPSLTPTQIQTSTPTKEVTPEPTQVMEVTNLTRESSMPWWVWVVLALTIACAGVIIWWLRHNNKDESEELDD